MKPVTSEEHAAAAEIFDNAAGDVTKAAILRRTTAAIKDIRMRSGKWTVHAESFDMPGLGYVVSEHPNEAEALTECRRLNRENQSDAGIYTYRRAPS